MYEEPNGKKREALFEAFLFIRALKKRIRRGHYTLRFLFFAAVSATGRGDVDPLVKDRT